MGKPVNGGAVVNVLAALNDAPADLLAALKAALATIEEEKLKSLQDIAAHAYTGTEPDFSDALAAAANIAPVQTNGTGDQPVTTATAEQPEAALV